MFASKPDLDLVGPAARPLCEFIREEARTIDKDSSSVPPSSRMNSLPQVPRVPHH